MPFADKRVLETNLQTENVATNGLTRVHIILHQREGETNIAFTERLLERARRREIEARIISMQEPEVLEILETAEVCSGRSLQQTVGANWRYDKWNNIVREVAEKLIQREFLLQHVVEGVTWLMAVGVGNSSYIRWIHVQSLRDPKWLERKLELLSKEGCHIRPAVLHTIFDMYRTQEVSTPAKAPMTAQKQVHRYSHRFAHVWSCFFAPDSGHQSVEQDQLLRECRNHF